MYNSSLKTTNNPPKTLSKIGYTKRKRKFETPKTLTDKSFQTIILHNSNWSNLKTPHLIFVIYAVHYYRTHIPKFSQIFTFLLSLHFSNIFYFLTNFNTPFHLTHLLTFNSISTANSKFQFQTQIQNLKYFFTFTLQQFWNTFSVKFIIW